MTRRVRAGVVLARCGGARVAVAGLRARAPGPTPDDAIPGKEKPPRRTDARIPWAGLLPKVFKEDVLRCHCGGRRQVLAFVKDSRAIEKILAHLGLPTTGPPLAPSRFEEEADRGWQDDVPAYQG